MIGVIDVGSNSVRLLLDGVKYIETTQLGEGTLLTRRLLPQAINRTVEAILSFVNFSKSKGINVVKIFGTEALRSAVNRSEFCSLLASHGLSIDILSSVIEAKIGFLGAYTGGCQAILDIGGASSELVVGKDDTIFYSHSLPLGAVRLKDYEKNDYNRLDNYIKENIKEYGTVPKFDKLISIGGTSSTIVAIVLKMTHYDPSAIHNFELTKDMIRDVIDQILSKPENERCNIIGLPAKKALVIAPSSILLLNILEYLKLDSCTVSERDNLEGYLSLFSKEEIVTL